MLQTETNLQEDIKTINKFSMVPIMLEAICRTTGMGFAAVARVTDERWIACSVLDEVKFGLMPGGELKLETTICHEIRQSGVEVVIDHVREDEVYHDHHTPNMYGLQSYISVPIYRQGTGFFGTLCAIDARPALLNTPEILGLFKAYAALISAYLNAVERESMHKINMMEERLRAELKHYLDVIRQLPAAQLEAAMVTKRDPQFNRAMEMSANKINMLVSELKS